MPGKRTILTAENGTIGTGRALFAFQTAAAGSNASNIKVSRIEISQAGSTTLGMVRGAFSTRDTAGTYTFTSTTPTMVGPLGGAASGLSGSTAPAGAVARSGTFSSADSGGTYTDRHYFNFANLNGYLWKPDPDEEIWVPPSTLFLVRFLADPATTTGWTVSAWLEEM
jgi:hypothetical protein